MQPDDTAPVDYDPPPTARLPLPVSDPGISSPEPPVPTPEAGHSSLVAAVARSSRPQVKRWVLAAIVAVVALAAVAWFVPARNTSDVAVEQSSAPDAAPTSLPESGPTGRPGSSDNPYGLDTPVKVEAQNSTTGAVWNVEVSAIEDLTQLVVDAHSFNTAPGEGIGYAGFHVRATLAEASDEPVHAGNLLDWRLVGGATGGVYWPNTLLDNEGCGLFPGEFEDIDQVFVGGTLTGMVCIPVPLSDLANPDSRPAIGTLTGSAEFAAGGQPSSPASIGISRGFGDYTERGLRSPVPIRAGDAETESTSFWNVLVRELVDETDSYLRSDRSNQTRPEGVVFAAFDVEITLASARESPIGIVDVMTWQILGGATHRAYSRATLLEVQGCGFLDDTLHDLDKLEIGDTVLGQVCIPLPIEDLEHINTRISLVHGGDRTVFADGGDLPAPAEIVEDE